MAWPSATILEVRSATGSDTNGGGFVQGASGADFSQQASKNGSSRGTTTLSGNGGSITSGATSAIVASATSLYGGLQTTLVGDWLKIDSEIVKVTAVSGNTLTITRAQLGTSAASHNDGATVTNISNASTTDLVTAGTTTISTAAGYLSANAVGNVVYIAGGTASITAGWYSITSVSTSGSSTTAVVDRSTGLTTGTGATFNLGGALATVANAITQSQAVGAAGNVVWCTGSESRTAALPANATNAMSVRGYSSSRYDGGKYSFTFTTVVGTVLSISFGLWENLKFNGSNTTYTSNFLLLGASSQTRNIEVTGVNGGSSIAAVQAAGCHRQMWVHGNNLSGYAVQSSGAAALQEVEINANPNLTAGWYISGSLTFYEMCDFAIYNNAGDGVRLNAASSAVLLSYGTIDGVVNGINNITTASSTPGIEAERCLITNCSGKAIAMTNNATQLYRTRLLSVYSYNNTSASTGNYEGTLTALAGNPYVNESGGNFALSSTGPDYATINQVGFTLPSTNTRDYSAAGVASVAPGGPLASDWNGGFNA